MPSSVRTDSTASVLREERVFVHALFAFEKQGREDDVMGWARSVSRAHRGEESSSSSSSSSSDEQTSKEEKRKSRKKSEAEPAMAPPGRTSRKGMAQESCAPWKQGSFPVSAVRQNAVALYAAVPHPFAFDTDGTDDLALPSDIGADYKLYQQHLAGTGTASIVSMHPYQCASIVHVARTMPSSTPAEQKSIRNAATPSKRVSQASSTTVKEKSETQGNPVTLSKGTL